MDARELKEADSLRELRTKTVVAAQLVPITDDEKGSRDGGRGGLAGSWSKL
jgi:hypothetical protein